MVAAADYAIFTPTVRLSAYQIVWANAAHGHDDGIGGAVNAALSTDATHLSERCGRALLRKCAGSNFSGDPGSRYDFGLALGKH